MNRVILVLIVLLPCYNAFSQDTLNMTYFKGLREKLSRDPQVKKTKLVVKKYPNGKIFRQGLYVKYKNDKTHRYWLTGQSFQYYPNGQLSCIEEVGISEKTFVDTSKCYDANGHLLQLLVFSSDPTIRTIPVKEIFDFFYFFRKYYKNFPEGYREVLFENGKRSEKNYMYSDEAGWVVDGDEVLYKQDGTIERVVKYKKGKVVE